LKFQELLLPFSVSSRVWPQSYISSSVVSSCDIYNFHNIQPPTSYSSTHSHIYTFSHWSLHLFLLIGNCQSHTSNSNCNCYRLSSRSSSLPTTTTTQNRRRLQGTGKMCYQVRELYSACKCLYYEHAVDRCASYGRHGIERKIVYVGYACSIHTGRSAYSSGGYYAQPEYSDSGYYSSRSSKSGSSHHYHR